MRQVKVWLGRRQVTTIYETLYLVKRAVEAGNLDENWMGDTPEDKKVFEHLVEKFGHLYEDHG